MLRYVTVPEPVTIFNPISGRAFMEPDFNKDNEPTPQVYTFKRTCRTALYLASHTGEHDVEKLHDLRARIDAVNPGDVLILSEDEWKILEPILRRPNPNAFGSCWAMGGGEVHARAWTHAPTEDPRRAATNGAAVVEAPPVQRS